MLETLVAAAAISLSSAVALTRPGTLPAAAMAGDRNHKVIVHIVSRDQTLTVKTGQKGLVYSLTGTNGKVMIADATAKEFAQLQPALYKQVRQFIAVRNDMSDATDTAASADRAMPVSADRAMPASALPLAIGSVE